MKKAVGIPLALLAIALAALPPWFGRMAEDAFRAQPERAPFQDYLEVRLVDYERGWYRSRATLELGLDSSYVELLRAAAVDDEEGAEPPEMDRLADLSADVTFRLVTDLAHGPVGYSGGPFLGLARGVMRPELTGGELDGWRERFDVPDLLEVRHRIGFGGVSRFDVVLPEIDYRGEEMRVSLEGWDVWAEYDPDSRRIAGTAGIEALEVSDDETNLRIESMRAEADGTILGPRLLLGEGGFRVDRFSLVRPLERIQRTDLVGFRATGGTELSDDGAALDSRFTYAVDSLLVGEEALREAELTMAALNVDRDAAERWAVFTERAALADSATVDGEAITKELTELLYDFLVAGPALEVDPARFRYAGEPFTARVRVTTDPSVLPRREAFEDVALLSLGFWTRVFTVEAEIDSSRSLARTLVAESQKSSIRAALARRGTSVPEERIAAMARQQADVVLSGLVEGGFLREEGDRYTSRLRYDDGQLTANGRAMPVPGA